MSASDNESADEMSDEPNDVAVETISEPPSLTPPKSASGDTFAARVFTAVGGRYSISMRRSVQTVVLYEANRCLHNHYGHLKPFQRKTALLDTAKDLVNSLSFVPLYQRMEIMFRTAAGKIALSPELAWRRMKLINREIKKTICPKISKLSEGCSSHDELCENFLQEEYNLHHSGKEDQKYHENWEFTHVNFFLAFRMYYVGGFINTKLPPARDPNPNRVVPTIKPIDLANLKNTEGRKRLLDRESASSFISEVMAEERRALLKEVKDHMEILNEFENIVPEEELKKRKKELFSSLPPIPTIEFD